MNATDNYKEDIKKTLYRIKITKLKRKILMGIIKDDELHVRWISGNITEDEYTEERTEIGKKYNCLSEDASVFCFSIDNLERDLERVDDIKRMLRDAHKKWDLK